MPGLYLSFTDLQCIPTDIPLISIFSDIFPAHVNKFRSRQLNKQLDTSRDLTFSASQIVNIIKYPPVESRIPKLNNCGQRTLDSEDRVPLHVIYPCSSKQTVTGNRCCQINYTVEKNLSKYLFMMKIAVIFDVFMIYMAPVYCAFVTHGPRAGVKKFQIHSTNGGDDDLFDSWDPRLSPHMYPEGIPSTTTSGNGIGQPKPKDLEKIGEFSVITLLSRNARRYLY